MNYAELTDHVQSIAEDAFSADLLAMFVQQAEQKIYNTVQIPALRKNDTLACVDGTQLVTVPTDFLYVYSAFVVDAGTHHALMNKDVNFIREAYPTVTATSRPKYYSYYSSTQLLLGPTPDAAYPIDLNYGYYPESIVTAGTTWLGDEFDSVLLNGALVEAARFMKAEPDVIANYDKLYMQSIALLKTLGDGKQRQDAYRSGQARIEVT